MTSTDRTAPERPSGAATRLTAEFTYRACSCQALRTFRLHRPPPLLVEFFTIRYFLELYAPTHTGGSERLVARLPWQDLANARELDHAGHGVLARKLLVAYDVDCGTLAEILFLRLVRQTDATELAGPHLKIPRLRAPVPLTSVARPGDR